MVNNELEQAEMLDSYWTALRDDPEAIPPTGLEAEVATLTRRLDAQMRPPEPGNIFAARLRQSLESGAEAKVSRNAHAASAERVTLVPKPHRRFSLLPLRALAGLGVAAALILMAVGANFWVSRPQPVSAAEIVKKAGDRAANMAGNNLTSFDMVEQTVSTAPSGEVRTVEHIWFQAPDRWRYEIQPQGSSPAPRIIVGDGHTIWNYDPQQNKIEVTEGQVQGRADLLGGGFSETSLTDLLQSGTTCYRPQLAGEDVVAGRPAYVVNMGATLCPSASMPDTNGPTRLWLDKETYFVLKSTIQDTAGTRVLQTTEVLSIEYNSVIPATTFAFVPPAGAAFEDQRAGTPQPEATFQQQIAEMAKKADFPIFVPSSVPDGMVPRHPLFDAQTGLQLMYILPDSGSAEREDMTITERKATYSMLARWTDGAEAVSSSGARVWLRRGTNNGGANQDSLVVVLRDGTMITVESARLDADKLLSVANSLSTVAGSHAPLSEPVPLTVSELRGRVSFPIFVPTYLPDGLTANPPLGGETPDENVEIEYYAQDGSKALLVLNGPKGCCLDADGTRGGESVQLANGTPAHLLPGIPESGGPILWWEQDSAYVALSGPHMTKDDLLKIAASMSNTAGLAPLQTTP